MNYTKPDSPDHEDDPKDWLSSALIFAKVLGLFMKENEGVVVKLQGDMVFNDCANENKKVIVYKCENLIRIIACEKNLDDGQKVLVNS